MWHFIILLALLVWGIESAIEKVRESRVSTKQPPEI